MTPLAPLVALALASALTCRAAELGDARGLLEQARAAATEDSKELRAVAPPVPGVDVSRAGHSAGPGTLGPGYDVWRLNCHSAANQFTAQATAMGLPAGIVACQGDPETSPSFHTPSWVVPDGRQTCLFNWGTSCCWEGAQNPPNLGSGTGAACARWACGVQYGRDQTRPLPAGRLVESPGPAVCVVRAAGGPPSVLPGARADALSERLRTGARAIRTRPHTGMPEGALFRFEPERLDPCLDCCASISQVWVSFAWLSPNGPMHSARAGTYFTQCERACRSAFQEEP